MLASRKSSKSKGNGGIKNVLNIRGKTQYNDIVTSNKKKTLKGRTHIQAVNSIEK